MNRFFQQNLEAVRLIKASQTSKQEINQFNEKSKILEAIIHTHYASWNLSIQHYY